MQIQQEKHEKYEKIGIGRRYFDKTLSGFVVTNQDQKNALNHCVDFVKGFKKHNAKGLFLIGKAGTGKTHMACASCKAILDKFERIKIYNITSLLDDIKTTYSNRTNKSESQIFQNLRSLDLLVLDDLGKEYSKTDNLGNSWVNEKLYRIINDRYEDNRPIIVTTNFSINDLERKIDPAIISRLLEMTIGINCNWEDFRKNGGKDGI